MMRAYFIFLLLFSVARAYGQSLPPIPERIVSIDCENCRTDDVLRQIASQGRFEFAYNAQLFDPSKMVTLHTGSVTVRRAIFLLFGNTITFRVRGNYLVLVAAPAPLPAAASASPKREYTVSGYTLDAETGAALPHVSVYDPVTLSSALSNEYGYYTIDVTGSRQTVQLKASRGQYADTLFAIVPVSNLTQDIRLRPLATPERVTLESVSASDSVTYIPSHRNVERYRLLDSLIGFVPVMQSRNLKEYFQRGGQVSLIPYVSTNGKLGGNVVNRFSLNVIGGYTGGTNGAEIGGMFNVDRQDVKWVQFAGAFNVVGGNVTGVQAAGAFNLDQGSLKGVQMAGGVNCLLDTLRGAQLAGGVNIIRGEVYGAQVAGGVNFVSRDMDGAQLAGGLNITLGKVNKVQCAGGVNYAWNVQGVQVAGGCNVVPATLTGTQLAGGFNFARQMNGLQVATVNVAGEMRGMQVGVVNFADSCSGVPLGLLSFVLKGVHELEFASTEKGMLSASFRTGVPAFYNILCASVQNDQTLWGFGYGFGHRFRLSKQFGMNLDVVAQHMSTERFADYTNEWGQLKLTLEWRPRNFFALAAGPVFNYVVSGSAEDELAAIHPAPLFSGIPSAGYHDLGWVGATVAVRFF